MVISFIVNCLKVEDIGKIFWGSPNIKAKHKFLSIIVVSEERKISVQIFVII
jgi:hypothetical protein